ncbi:MAG: hypothetical protein KC912_24575 [Proteobacteria bacterium]|nr:hypothetical protein [Pseudomonadota bacterium]
MSKLVLLGLSLALPSAALACPGKGTMTASAADTKAVAADTETVAAVDPTHCAKKASLVGSNCSYTTGMMAQRIVAEGSNHAFAGMLTSFDEELESHVAAPFTLGSDVHVVANAVIEQLTEAGLTDSRVSLEGKMLEIDGVKYFVATRYVSLAA